MENTRCGCCDAVQLRTPNVIENRTGLSVVKYRIGDYTAFRSSLLSKLTIRQLEGLKKLTTRSDDDFTIALLDAFAVLADVLTFYQERIANESYLKTATERKSVSEMAAMIGYELNPGVAATTHLSFILEDNSLQPGQELLRDLQSSGNEKPIVKMGKGIKAQSIPEPEELPQIFETIEAIEGKADWNAMHVKSFEEQDQLAIASKIYIKGLTNNIKIGDQILVVKGGIKTIKKVLKVELLSDSDTTLLSFEVVMEHIVSNPILVVYPMAHYYTIPLVLNSGAISSIVNPTNTVSSIELNSAIAIQNWSPYEFKTSINTIALETETKVFIFRNNACVLGYNAPKKITKIADNGDVSKEEHTLNEKNNQLFLDAEYPEIINGEGSYIAFKNNKNPNLIPLKVVSAELMPKTKYGISAKSTKVIVDNFAWNSDEKFSALRTAKVYIQNEKLPLALKPITNSIHKGTSKILLSKFYIDLIIGQKILISGEITELPGIIRTEIHTIQEIALVDKYTQITTARSLENSYVRKTVRVNANVALASHGETVTEVLGSGDASVTFQKFELKHIPVTYLTDDSFTGASSTIEITVNDIHWKEVPYFYKRNPDEHIFTVRKNDNEVTTITFGDGVHGSRLPTGKLNVRSTYRKGIGANGLLKSNQITQLLTKPLYVKSAHNPMATLGAENPEYIEDARQNANLSIHTLDRIVSLQDYEDFARSFAGIEKARSVWLWSQSGKKVHLTIAGSGGTEIPENSEVLKNLTTAIQKYSYPGVHLQIISFRQRYFRIKGNLSVIETYDFQKVHDEVVGTLKERYSFKNRNIGQHIHLSEIIAIVESIEGVNYIDIDTLYVTGTSQTLGKTLIAQIISPNNTSISGSELLILDTTPLKFNTVL